MKDMLAASINVLALGDRHHEIHLARRWWRKKQDYQLLKGPDLVSPRLAFAYGNTWRETRLRLPKVWVCFPAPLSTLLCYGPQMLSSSLAFCYCGEPSRFR